MNAKKCKAIRRELRGFAERVASIGKPLQPDGLVLHNTHKLMGYDPDRKPVFKQTARNVVGSARAIYLQLKRAAA